MGGRPTSTARDVVAGCNACYGTETRWRGPNAQATAARHHDAHQHQTWVEVTLKIVYGRGADPDKELRLDLGNALA